MGIDHLVQKGRVVVQFFAASKEEGLYEKAANFLPDVGCLHDSDGPSSDRPRGRCAMIIVVRDELGIGQRYSMGKYGEIDVPPRIALKYNRAAGQNRDVPTYERHAAKRGVGLLRQIENFSPARQLHADEMDTGVGMSLEPGNSDCFVFLNRRTADSSGGKVDRRGQSALRDVIDNRLPDRHSYRRRHEIDRPGRSAAGYQADGS